MGISREINKRCLKRDQDIGRKAVLSDVKTAFRCTPALTLLILYSVVHSNLQLLTNGSSFCSVYEENLVSVFTTNLYITT